MALLKSSPVPAGAPGTDAGSPYVARVRGHSRSFGDTHVLRSIDLDIRPRRVRRAARPQRLRQVDPAAQPGAASTPSPRARSRSTAAPRSRSRSRGCCRGGPCTRTSRSRCSTAPERRSRFELAEQTLAEVGLTEKLGAWPLQLSGGQAQRVSLARALVSNPALLLLDEPFSALDALTRIEMHQLVIELWRRHSMAILIVTHDVDEALALADRVLVIDEGRSPGPGRSPSRAPTARRPSPRSPAPGARSSPRSACSPLPRTRSATRSRSKEQHETQGIHLRRRPRIAAGAAPAQRLRRRRHRQRGRRQRRRLGRPVEGDPDRRRPEGRLEGAAHGGRRARRRRRTRSSGRSSPPGRRCSRR